MSFLHHPLERKLSALIGAKVSFEKVKMSLLGGWIEASGVSVAGSASGEPLLTARRIHAEISVRHALAKQFVVKSLIIEQPIINIVLGGQAGGNLPHRAVQPATDGAQQEDHWSWGALRVVILHAQLHIHDATAGSKYHASVEPINAELCRQGDQVNVSLDAASITRHDRILRWGNVKLNGAFKPVIVAGRQKITGLLKQTLHWLVETQLQAALEFGGGIKLEIHSHSVTETSATFKLDGPLDIAELAALIPPSVKLPQQFTEGRTTGRGNVSIEGKIAEDTLQISQCVIRLSDIASRFFSLG